MIKLKKKIQLKVNHVPLWILDLICQSHNISLECDGGHAFLNLLEVVRK